MIPLADIRDLKLFEALSDAAVEALCADAEMRDFEACDYLLHQHDEAHSLYILLSGTVEFLIKVEGVDDLFVGMTAERGPLLGWSIVREPHRYTATVRCAEPCRVIRIPRRAFAEVLKNDPRAGYALLQTIAEAVADRLQDALGLLSGIPKSGPRAAT
ncbi:MAG: cyclic nucleotide-binding domain-containing protein [Alphaproteobacteria bacterium]|nr:cyclic nucleotide-binding domain-containing protein [Alphaproteobacteria bacterium]